MAASAGLNCSCAGNPRITAPAPGLLTRLEAELRAVVTRALTVVRKLVCPLAAQVLREAIQTFLDGVAIECPECLPVLVPIASVLYIRALSELEKTCSP